MMVNVRVVKFQGNTRALAWFDKKNSVNTLIQVPMTVCGLLNFQIMCKFFKINFIFFRIYLEFLFSFFSPVKICPILSELTKS